MFKKIMKLFSSIVLLFVFVCIFTSCESEESKTSHTTHSYSYKSNAQKHWQECSCGDKKDEEDHTFGGWITTKEATITSTGTKERECSVCNYKETDTIAVLTHDTHSYTEIKSNETKHWKECSCGAKSEEENHTFGKWVTIKEPTETTDGVKERECSVCHYKETDTIAKHAHSFTETKSNETKHWKECSCGAKSEEENHTFGNWQTIKEASYIEKGLKKRVCSKCNYEETEDIAIKEITDISTFIKDNNDIITANLETQYQGVLKQAFGRAYGTSRFEVKTYRWDLGEVVNEKIQNLKMILNYYDNNALGTTLRVYDVTLSESIDLKTLLNSSAMSNVKTTTVPTYTYTYDATKQHDRDDLMKAILDVAVTDGFKYEMKDVYYTENTPSTDSTLGTIRRFEVHIVNENAIRDIFIAISNVSSDTSLINNISKGKYIVSFRDNVNFTSNQLKEVVGDKKFTLEETTEDGFVFSFDGTEWFLTSYIGTKPNIVLPENYKDKEYSIFRKAFFYKDIKTIQFPKKLKEIGDDAFAGCKKLTFLNTLNSEKIGVSSFAGCDSIETLNIGSDTLIIYGGAFRACKNLNVVTLGTKVERIHGGAFIGCPKLTSITIPASVVELGTKVSVSSYSAFSSNIAEATFLSKTGWKYYSRYQLADVDRSKMNNPTTAAEYIYYYMTKE